MRSSERERLAANRSTSVVDTKANQDDTTSRPQQKTNGLFDQHGRVVLRYRVDRQDNGPIK